MKIGKRNLHFHSVSVHFTSALYPVAIFFLFLSYLYRREFSLFAYLHLMVLATLSVPVSYLTGFLEWKQKYKGAAVRTFARKYQFGLVLLGLGTACTLWYGLYPEVLRDKGILLIFFLVLNAAILPVVVYLGHLGGRIVFGGH